MVTFDFPPMTDKVKVVFECPECGEQVESDFPSEKASVAEKAG